MQRDIESVKERDDQEDLDVDGRRVLTLEIWFDSRSSR